MSPEQPIIERVKKLLALSKSSNVAEAELALNKANELIQRYNINIIEAFDEKTNKWSFQVHDDGGQNAIFYGSRIQDWENHLMHKLLEYCDGKCVVMGYKETTRYCFIGLENDAQLCKMLFWDINSRIRRIYTKQKKALGLTELHSFAYGVVVSLTARMLEAKNTMLQHQVSERGLVTIDHKNDAFNTYFEDLVRTKFTGTHSHSYSQKINWESYSTGKKVGQDMEMPVVNPVL